MANGTGVIAFSPLDQGKLTAKYLGEGVPDDSRAGVWWDKQAVEEVVSLSERDKLNALNVIARERGQSLAQLALAWILRLEAVTSVLIGASKAEQIRENVQALQNLKLTPLELAAIDKITLG